MICKVLIILQKMSFLIFNENWWRWYLLFYIINFLSHDIVIRSAHIIRNYNCQRWRNVSIWIFQIFIATWKSLNVKNRCWLIILVLLQQRCSWFLLLFEYRCHNCAYDVRNKRKQIVSALSFLLLQSQVSVVCSSSSRLLSITHSIIFSDLVSCLRIIKYLWLSYFNEFTLVMF